MRFQNQQQRANPYNPDDPDEKDEYEAFRAGYYTGYVAFELVAMVVGEQAKTAVKSTKTFSKLVDKLDRNGRLTQLQRYLDAVKGRTTQPVKRGSYKLGARLGKGSVWLTKKSGQRILSGAKTAAGQARLYRQLRKIDGYKLDDLSRSQEDRLRGLLLRNGDDGVDAINDLDGDSVETLLDLRPSCSGRFSISTLGGGGCVSKETIEDAIDTIVKASDNPRFSETDLDSVTEWLSKMDSSNRERTLNLLADADSDGVQIVRYFDSNSKLDSDDLRNLVDSTDEIDAVRRSDDGLTIEAERHGIDVKMNYRDDASDFYTENSDEIDSIDEIRDMSSQKIGADVVEDDIVPKLVERRTGYDVVYAEQKGGTDAGIDLIAKDDAGNYVVTEIKFTRSDKTPGKSFLNSKRELDDGTKARQMTDEWISDAFEEEISRETFDEYSDVRAAIRANNYRKEVIVIQDGFIGRSITEELTDFGIDGVSIVRTGGVTE